jgi:transposase
VALELAEGKWKLGFTVAFGQRPRQREIAARDTAALVVEIEQALRRFGLEATTPVLSCYEAGRDGFWLHRFTGARGCDKPGRGRGQHGSGARPTPAEDGPAGRE